MLALQTPATELQPTRPHLWVADVGVLVDTEFAIACESLLDHSELERNRRFRREEHRRLDVLARAVVRSALSAIVDVPPHEWRFEPDANGRPRVAEPSLEGLHFSLSHSGRLVACVVAREPAIGVDVERIDPRNIVADALAPQERRSLSSAGSRDTFFAYWTLREAHTKALGTGLTDDARTSWFELTSEHGATLYENGRPAPGWWFYRFTPRDEYVLAVAMHCEPAMAPVLTHHDWAAEFHAGAG